MTVSINTNAAEIEYWSLLLLLLCLIAITIIVIDTVIVIIVIIEIDTIVVIIIIICDSKVIGAITISLNLTITHTLCSLLYKYQCPYHDERFKQE